MVHWGFAAIPAAYSIGFAPVALRGWLIFRHNDELTAERPGEPLLARTLRVHGIANVQPRQAVDALWGRIPDRDHSLLRRCDGAAANAAEGLPLFASAILAGETAKVPRRWIGAAAGAYLATRCAYTAAYLRQEEPLMAAARSAAWTAGTATCLGLLMAAAKFAA